MSVETKKKIERKAWDELKNLKEPEVATAGSTASASAIAETEVDREFELDDTEEPEEEFDPSLHEHLIRQHQMASYHMLSQFLTVQDEGRTKGRNVADVLQDVRVSLDCLTKCVLQLSKSMEKLVPK